MPLTKTVLGRLIAIFLLALIPIYAAGMSIYQWGVRTTQEAVVDRTLSQLRFYMELMESDLTRLVILQSDFLNSKDISWLSNTHAYMSNYERGMAINNLQKRLLYITSASSYAEHTSAILPSMEQSIGSLSGLMPISSAQQELLGLSGANGLPLVLTDSGLYSNMVFRVPGRPPIYGVSIRLSLAKMRQELRKFDYDQNAASLLIWEGREEPLVITRSDSPYAPIVREMHRQREENQQDTGFFTLDAHGTRTLSLYAHSAEMGLTLLSFAPEKEIFAPVTQYRLFLWIFLLTGGLIWALFSLFVHRTIHRPLHKLLAAFARVDSRELSFAIAYKRDDEYRHLYDQFNQMVRNLDILINQSYEQKIMLRNAELKHLQAQINPHFLYNSYFLLYRMIKRRDWEQAEPLAHHMGEYFRFITRNARDMVPLCDEVQHARIYTDIQAARFEGRMEVFFAALPERFSSLAVPKLILQPLIENAFEHGLRNKAADGILQVQFVCAPIGLLHIRIEDNGEETTPEDIERLNAALEETGEELTATRNIHRRLRLTFGGESGLAFSRSTLGGLCIQASIRPEGGDGT